MGMTLGRQCRDNCGKPIPTVQEVYKYLTSNTVNLVDQELPPGDDMRASTVVGEEVVRLG